MIDIFCLFFSIFFTYFLHWFLSHGISRNVAEQEGQNKNGTEAEKESPDFKVQSHDTRS